MNLKQIIIQAWKDSHEQDTYNTTKLNEEKFFEYIDKISNSVKICGVEQCKFLDDYQIEQIDKILE